MIDALILRRSELRAGLSEMEISELRQIEGRIDEIEMEEMREDFERLDAIVVRLERLAKEISRVAKCTG